MRLTEINLYPIKSLRGTPISEAMVCNYGLENDRCWMLVDDEGKKITQRECPRLATFVPRLEDGQLCVQVPQAASITVPLDGSACTGKKITVDLWGHEHVGVVATECINNEFSAAIGIKCQLLWLHGNGAAFHDDAPIMVISQSSLEELNRRLPAPVSMNRFRPNLVVDGSSAFEENNWQRVAIGEAKFSVVKACLRCSITTVDQALGEFRGPEPLKTLATFRREGQNVAFGAHFKPESAGAKIRGGDGLRVLETKTMSHVVAPGQ